MTRPQLARPDCLTRLRRLKLRRWLALGETPDPLASLKRRVVPIPVLPAPARAGAPITPEGVADLCAAAWSHAAIAEPACAAGQKTQRKKWRSGRRRASHEAPCFHYRRIAGTGRRWKRPTIARSSCAPLFTRGDPDRGELEPSAHLFPPPRRCEPSHTRSRFRHPAGRFLDPRVYARREGRACRLND